MYIFTSQHRRLKIFGQSDEKRKPGWQAIFQPNGIAGFFQTEDKELAEKLRQHKEYHKSFTEVKSLRGGSARVHVGERSAGMSQEQAMRLGELKATILKKDGEYRKDATPELIKEYESLKEGMGV